MITTSIALVNFCTINFKPNNVFSESNNLKTKYFSLDMKTVDVESFSVPVLSNDNLHNNRKTT